MAERPSCSTGADFDMDAAKRVPAPAGFGPEAGLSLVSAMLGMMIMVVLMGIVVRKEVDNQSAQRQGLIGGYYRFIGSTLASAPSGNTLQQDVDSGILPKGILESNGKDFNKDILGNNPTINKSGSDLVIVSGGPVPFSQIRFLGKWQSFGESGGACGPTTVCSGNGSATGWSVSVPQASAGYGYYGYSPG